VQGRDHSSMNPPFLELLVAIFVHQARIFILCRSLFPMKRGKHNKESKKSQ
jgi:hypothetical protein